jgi:DNA-directed RNA polymerase specialized sigma24 family protein
MRFDPRLHAYVRKSQCSPGEGDELVWDVWQEASTDCEAAITATADPWSLLRDLLKGCMATRKRVWRREVPPDDSGFDLLPAIPQSDEPTEDRGLTVWTNGALAALTRNQRLAVVLRYRRGWSYSRIARAIGTAEPTARVHAARGIINLRAMIRPSSDAHRCACIERLKKPA